MKESLKILGIETTCHSFGCGVATSEGKILSNIVSEYIPPKGGIHPREAAQHHCRVASKVVKESLKEAGLSADGVDGVAVSIGPGQGPSLRTGCTAARALALRWNKPLIPVNHCIAHIEIGRLTTGLMDPLVVYVSGGNTIIAAYSEGRYRVFGETLDIALGNFLDVFAREAGLPHPGGPQIERLARKGGRFIPLPLAIKGQDVSYSGLLTAALTKLKEGNPLEDLCFSIQEVSFSMLAEVAERALAHTEKKEMLLTGGVAKNRRLQEMLRIIAEEHDAKFQVVPPEYAMDNGAMIAWTGLLAYTHGVKVKVEESYVKPRWRMDEVNIPWRL